MKITLPVLPLAEGEMNSDHLNLLLNMLLAGVVTIGFAVFYNAAWLQVGLAAVGGMVGHGIRSWLFRRTGMRAPPLFWVALPLASSPLGLPDPTSCLWPWFPLPER